jgi:YesN/AraC family two-component response regulator
MNSLEKERMILAAFQRGDIETGKKIITEIITSFNTSWRSNFEGIQFRALELAVIFSRAALINEDSDFDAILEANSRNLKRIQESETPEALIKNLHLAAEAMAGNIFSFRGKRHASVLRKAQRYIWDNYTRKISLDEISKASGVSSPYFSSIFKEEMGENFSSYLNRLRIGRAMLLLTETIKPLHVIAGQCGFEDQSWFSKIFKNLTGVSPGKYRKTGSSIREPNAS